jgi:hypothetical protein
VHPVQHAAAAAEAVRALNHATVHVRGQDGYASAEDVDEVLAQLAALAQRLPQALEQAARWLERAGTTGHVDHDRGLDGDRAATLAGVLMRAGAAAAQTMQRRLEETRQITSHLTGSRNPLGHAGAPERPLVARAGEAPISFGEWWE